MGTLDYFDVTFRRKNESKIVINVKLIVKINQKMK